MRTSLPLAFKGYLCPECREYPPHLHHFRWASGYADAMHRRARLGQRRSPGRINGRVAAP